MIILFWVLGVLGGSLALTVFISLITRTVFRAYYEEKRRHLQEMLRIGNAEEAA